MYKHLDVEALLVYHYDYILLKMFFVPCPTRLMVFIPIQRGFYLLE